MEVPPVTAGRLLAATTLLAGIVSWASLRNVDQGCIVTGFTNNGFYASSPGGPPYVYAPLGRPSGTLPDLVSLAADLPPLSPAPPSGRPYLGLSGDAAHGGAYFKLVGGAESGVLLRAPLATAGPRLDRLDKTAVAASNALMPLPPIEGWRDESGQLTGARVSHCTAAPPAPLRIPSRPAQQMFEGIPVGGRGGGGSLLGGPGQGDGGGASLLWRAKGTALFLAVNLGYACHLHSSRVSPEQVAIR